MILTRQQKLFRGNGSAPNARAIADGVITALSPAAWYRNATGVTEAGGFASKWDDYSGNARHLVQATGTNQPAYAAGVLTFDGADNYMRTATFAFAQPEWIVLVLNQVSWTVNDYIFDGFTSNGGRLGQEVSSPSIRIMAGSFAAANSDLAVGTFGIASIVINGASSSIKINNNTATGGDVGVNDMAGLNLGSLGNGVSNFSNIAVKEMILFPFAPSASEELSVITALNNALTVF